MRKASILVATAALLGAACATAPSHLTGGNGTGTTSAGSVNLRLQPGAAVQAEPQARPSLAPGARVTRGPGRQPAPQSRPAQPSASAAPGTGPTDSSALRPALPPTDRCLGSPTANPHQPELMCALP
jgi:hypothetical protein